MNDLADWGPGNAQTDRETSRPDGIAVWIPDPDLNIERPTGQGDVADQDAMKLDRWILELLQAES